MAAPSTRQKLLSLIEDVEIVSKELLEFLSTPKQQRTDDVDTEQLVQLLIQKDKEVQEALKTAQEQGDLQKKLDALKAEVESRDQDIRQLQKSLKDAESILATAIYQAKQKLQSVSQANGRKISSEELIKYAHKISASNAVAAPATWAPGDPRRPYPTELDMRLGILAKFGDPSITSQTLQQQATFADTSMALGHSQSQLEHSLQSTPQPPTGGPSLTWQHGVELPSNLGGSRASGLTPPSAHGHGLESKHHTKDTEDVEMMSTESSSSSSSDE